MRIVNNDPLKTLLRQADRPAPVAGLEESLAQRVRRRVSRRRAARRAVGTALVLLAIGPVVWWVHRPRSVQTPGAQLVVAQTQIVPLSDEETARLAELTVADMDRLRREQAAVKVTSALNVDDRVQLSLYETAATLLANGDLLMHENAGAAQAAAAYKLVQTQFPDSPVATLAADRLKRIGS
ncbi:MAG: hypothetical protein ABSH22_17230 [Tepidisphaeraceae bacterium]|jgi:hypothetical protein